MAERTEISTKLKLTVSYQDDAGETKNRQMTLANLKSGAAPDNIVAAVAAIGILQDDPITAIREVTETEITA